ncbi:MAG: catalase HPII, partial [Chitinophagaceae bacterium]
VVPVHNNQRDGYMRQQINKGRTSYNPNTLGNGCPFQAGKVDGGFSSYAEKIDAKKVRERSRSFFDHFSQAKLFFNSQSEPEKQHIADAFSFELGKVETKEIRERMLGILSLVDTGLASQVAYKLGLHVPAPEKPINKSVPADGKPEDFEPVIKDPSVFASAALSMANTIKETIKTRKVAVLVADGVSDDSVMTVQDILLEAGAVVDIIAPRLGTVQGEKDTLIPIKQSLFTTASVLYDAVYVPGGTNSVATLAKDPDAIHFLNEAYRHCKPIAADEAARQVLEETYFYKKLPTDSSEETVLEEGVAIHAEPARLAQLFTRIIAMHRFWDREVSRKVPG